MAAYIRYTVTEIDSHSHHPKGIFTASGELRKSKELPQDLYDRLVAIHRWFNDNLDAPETIDQRAIFWFKTSAEECIHRIWDLLGLLRAYGYHIEEVSCDRPGKIRYEDEYQIAAIPFRDTRMRR